MTYVFQFESVSNIPLPLENRETVPGQIYAIKVYGNLFGWTGKNEKNEWICWNSQGDFWSSFGKSRLEAATKMMDAPW